MTGERLTGGYAALQERDDTFVARGMALGAGDLTRGGSGKATYWPPDVVEGAADDLAGQPFATSRDHTSNKPRLHTPPQAIAGEVNWSGFGEVDGQSGVLYETEVDDEDIARNIENDRLEVSPLVFRNVVPADEYDGAYADDVPAEADAVATEIKYWRDLAAVRNGASPSNHIEPGAATAMSAEALHAAVAALKSAAGVEFDGTRDGKLDESEIPTDDYESHYLFPGDTKSDSSYPVVDGEGTLRRGNVEAAYSMGARGGVSEDDLHSKLSTLNDEFDDPPIDADALAHRGGDDGQTADGQSTPANDDTPTMDLTDKEQELIAAARQTDDPVVVEAEVRERLSDLEEQTDEHEEIIEAADDVDDPEVMDTETADAMRDRVSIVEEMMDQTLVDQTGLREGTVEAMSFDAKAEEFRDDEGEFDAEALVQEPETGEPNGEPESLSEETLEEAREIQSDIEALGTAAPESLKEDVADLVDEDSYADALEVL